MFPRRKNRLRSRLRNPGQLEETDQSKKKDPLLQLATGIVYGLETKTSGSREHFLTQSVHSRLHVAAEGRLKGTAIDSPEPLHAASLSASLDILLVIKAIEGRLARGAGQVPASGVSV
jgi:hypothetical protein